MEYSHNTRFPDFQPPPPPPPSPPTYIDHSYDSDYYDSNYYDSNYYDSDYFAPTPSPFYSDPFSKTSLPHSTALFPSLSRPLEPSTDGNLLLNLDPTPSPRRMVASQRYKYEVANKYKSADSTRSQLLRRYGRNASHEPEPQPRRRYLEPASDPNSRRKRDILKLIGTPEENLRWAREARTRAQSADTPTFTRPPPPSPRRLGLRLVVQGKECFAQPDAGSENCIIDESLARSLGSRIQNKSEEDRPMFTFANGGTVRAVGRVLLSCSFWGEASTVTERWFYVLRGCAEPLIVGKDFLDETATLTKNRHRLESLPLPSPPPSSPYRRRGLRLVVQGKECFARHDTGSEKCIIDESLARSLGSRIQNKCEEDRQEFEIGNGNIIRAVGRVLLSCGFWGEASTVTERWFHVLRKCAVPLIMGLDFLDETATMTKNRHRLEPLPPGAAATPVITWAGAARRRLGCSVNGTYVPANADSGSDLNLVSKGFAARNGLKLDRRREARLIVQVADGSTSTTAGRVQVTGFRMGTSQHRWQPEAPRSITCHVLDGLPCDMLLGDELLEETDAFNSYADDFFDRGEKSDNADDDDSRVPFELNIYTNLGRLQSALAAGLRKLTRPSWVPSPGRDEPDATVAPAGASASASADSLRDLADQVEIRRRRKEALRIGRLDGSERIEAAREEELRQRAYESTRSGASTPVSSYATTSSGDVSSSASLC